MLLLCSQDAINCFKLSVGKWADGISDKINGGEQEFEPKFMVHLLYQYSWFPLA